jgi:hypothetical protein
MPHRRTVTRLIPIEVGEKLATRGSQYILPSPGDKRLKRSIRLVVRRDAEAWREPSISIRQTAVTSSRRKVGLTLRTRSFFLAASTTSPVTSVPLATDHRIAKANVFIHLEAQRLAGLDVDGNGLEHADGERYAIENVDSMSLPGSRCRQSMGQPAVPGGFRRQDYASPR